MASHRTSNDITELKNYWNSVIDWASTIFRIVEKEMQGLEWGRLYETYGKLAYSPADATAHVERLYGDFYVKNRRGIFEYVLGGCENSRLLDIRVFDEATKQATYKQQTANAQKAGTSNCPFCSLGHDSNKAKIWSIKEMDADHVTAWSKGGATDIKNCQMLCRAHNQAKGNK